MEKLKANSAGASPSLTKKDEGMEPFFRPVSAVAKWDS